MNKTAAKYEAYAKALDAAHAAAAITALGAVLLLAAQGDRIGQGFGYAVLTIITAAQQIEPRCRPDEPTIYIGGMLMAGCPNKTRQ